MQEVKYEGVYFSKYVRLDNEYKIDMVYMLSVFRTQQKGAHG